MTYASAVAHPEGQFAKLVAGDSDDDHATLVGESSLAALVTGKDTQLNTLDRLSVGYHLCDEHHVGGIAVIVNRSEDCGHSINTLKGIIPSGTSSGCGISGIGEGACLLSLDLVTKTRSELFERSDPFITVIIGDTPLTLDELVVLRLHAGERLVEVHDGEAVEAHPAPSIHH